MCAQCRVRDWESQLGSERKKPSGEKRSSSPSLHHRPGGACVVCTAVCHCIAYMYMYMCMYMGKGDHKPSTAGPNAVVGCPEPFGSTRAHCPNKAMGRSKVSYSERRTSWPFSVLESPNRSYIPRLVIVGLGRSVGELPVRFLVTWPVGRCVKNQPHDNIDPRRCYCVP